MRQKEEITEKASPTDKLGKCVHPVYTIPSYTLYVLCTLDYSYSTIRAAYLYAGYNIMYKHIQLSERNRSHDIGREE